MITRSTRRKLFEQEEQAFVPTTSIKKTYVRKRRKNTKEREELGKAIDIPISNAPVTSQLE